MPIDNCEHDFEKLQRDVLPRYMRDMRNAMLTPTPMSVFSTKGVGVKRVLQQLNRNRDFEGCYVLMDREEPIYVGISRTVAGRLIQHVRGSTHFSASLAYRMAVARHPHKMTRAEAMAHEEFYGHFVDRQVYLRGLSAAFIEISNPLERYLFEAFCAMKLDTATWNTFKEH